ncbi:hypothetical protein, partial [Maribacter aquivivus]|uniref:hypothetical protein n=1 Tax=Maribacter aquivivus TaxID=228958 RepID=UPI002494FA83
VTTNIHQLIIHQSLGSSPNLKTNIMKNFQKVLPITSVKLNLLNAIKDKQRKILSIERHLAF